MKENNRKNSHKNNENDKLVTFNEKYNTELEHELMIIDVPNKNLGDEGFKLLSEIPFNLLNHINELNISENSIIDISPLININKINLKKLNLSKNRIEDISPLEKIKLNELEVLNISFNKIQDVSILSKINLNNLAELDISSNKISDISSLEFMNCTNLVNIDVSSNNILDITVFERINFPQLNHISCENNYFSHELIKNNDIISNLRKNGCNITIWGTTKQLIYG